MVIDARTPDMADREVYNLLQPKIRRRDPDSALLEWVYEQPKRFMDASIKPLKPIRSVVEGGYSQLDSISEEYDRALAIKALEESDV